MALAVGVSTICWLITESSSLWRALRHTVIMVAGPHPVGGLFWLSISTAFEDRQITAPMLAPPAGLLALGLAIGAAPAGAAPGARRRVRGRPGGHRLRQPPERRAHAHADAADRLVLGRLDPFVSAEGWRREGLTIGALAAELQILEHRLRRLINNRLGHRNFADFLSVSRIKAARRRLANPHEACTTVATICWSSLVNDLRGYVIFAVAPPTTTYITPRRAGTMRPGSLGGTAGSGLSTQNTTPATPRPLAARCSRAQAYNPRRTLSKPDLASPADPRSRRRRQATCGRRLGVARLSFGRGFTTDGKRLN